MALKTRDQLKSVFCFYDFELLMHACMTCLGLQHQFVQCDGCGYDGVTGMRWKCVKCYDFDLCSLCYMTGKHDTSHPFQRYDNLGVG